MLYAICDNSKVTATPGARATCPNCQDEVLAKCGSINIWHWSHRAIEKCDAWSESETEWHLKWKSVMPPKLTEVPIIKNDQKHIADIVKTNGWVVELQHSPISPEEIRERERFYDHMFWLFDIRDCRKNGEYRFNIYSKGNYWTFKWKYPRKHIAVASNVFLDIGSNIFQVKKIHTSETPYGGWGYLWEREAFTHWLKAEK